MILSLMKVIENHCVEAVVAAAIDEVDLLRIESLLLKKESLLSKRTMSESSEKEFE